MAWLSYVVAGGTKAWEEIIDPDASPEIQFSRNSASYTRYFKVAKDDAETFLQECMPTGAYIPPSHPGFSLLFIDTVNFKPFPGATFTEAATGVNEPDSWHVSVTYSPWRADPAPPGSYDPETPPVDVLTTNLQFTTEAMSVPGYSLKWETTGNAIASENVSAYILIHQTQFEITVPRARSIPWNSIRANRGRVNGAPFWGADAERILYNGASVSVKFLSDGTKTFDIAHSFTEKEIIWGQKRFGWNHVWDPDSKSFDRPLAFNEGNTLYEKSNSFASLLTV